MAAFCPNLSDPQVKSDFDSIKQAFSENVAYYLWDKYQGDMTQISNVMKTLPIKEIVPLAGQEPSSGESGYRSGKGPRINVSTHPISERHNDNVWEAEKKFKNTFFRTVNGKKMKYWRSYSQDEAIKLKNNILNEYFNVKVLLKEAYDGGTAVVIEGYPESYDEVTARHQNALEKDSKEYRQELDKETREDLLPDPLTQTTEDIPKVVTNPEQELANIRKVLAKTKETSNAKAILESLRDSGLTTDPKLSRLIDFLILHSESNPYLTISTIDKKDLAENELNYYMYFDPNDHQVYMVNEAVNNKPSYDYFVRGMLHEYIHGFTDKAMTDPQTPGEVEFKKKMETLWKSAKKSANNPELYGYDSAKEFVSEMFVREEFVDEVKTLPYNWFYRFIQNVLDLLKIDIKVGPRIDEAVIRTVLDFVPTQDDFVNLSDEKLDVSPMPVQDVINKIRKNKNLNNREEFVNLVRNFEKQFTFKGGTKHKDTGFAMTPVTSIINQFGMGIDQEELDSNENLKEAIERSNYVGNVVHGTIESILTGQAASYGNDNPFSGSVGLRKDLSQIMARFEGEKVTIMSEVFIGDPRKAVSGKIDMVIIDSKNRVHLYDFKTKEKGFENYTLRYRNRADGSMKYSARHRAHAQLTMYKQIWEEMTGTQVASMNVILLNPEVNEDNKVTGVAPDSSYKFGVDTFQTPNVHGRKIYESIRNTNATRKSIMSGIPGIENPKRSFRTEQELKKFAAESVQFSKIDTALNKLITSLEGQIESTKKRGTIAQVDELQKKLDEVRREDDAIKALEKLLSFAMTSTADINKLYASMKQKGTPITIGRLYGWKDTVMAFEGFSDYAQYLADQIPMIKDKKHTDEYNKLLDRLEQLNIRVERIKNRYETEGIGKLVDFLVPYYNGIKVEVKNEAKLAYRKLSPSEKKAMTEEQYIKEILEENEENIDVRTRAELTNQLKRASRDINDIGRWLDNVLDSKDPVIAAMVKAFAKTEHISHLESLEARDKILAKLREFEKTISDSLGAVAYEKIYAYMLEKDGKGELTGYFVEKFSSKLWEDYNEIIAETKDYSLEDRLAARREWKNERTTLNKEAFKEGKAELLELMLEEGDITSHQLDLIKEQEKEFIKALAANEEIDTIPSLKDLANQGLVSHEAVDRIDNWIYKNAWSFRSINDEWKDQYENPQWGELMQHKADNTVQWQLYETIMELLEEANDMLPYSTRIGRRLPGVMKSSSEMVKSGQKLSTVVKESFKNNFDIRPDDIERDNFDNEGNPKYFLPIHYAGNIVKKHGVGLQSFDVPTIIFKFWQSANDFNHKIQILPEMELAKHFVNTRKADVVKMRKLKVPFRKIDNKEELLANNNNLSKQLTDWFATAVYGQPKKNQGTVLGMDTAKLADAMGKYTSLNLLGLNVIQGTANAILGEALQTAERIAGEYIPKSAYRKGTAFYMKNFAGILGDVGQRGSKNIVTMLMEDFDVLDNWEGSDFSKRQKYRHAMTSNTLFFTTHAGEHEMQGRFLLSMLADKEAFDKDGNSLGSMLNLYSVNKETGRKQLDPRVDLEKSEWTEDDQFDFSYKTRGILSRLHGEYSDLGKVAIQRGAAGRMAFMFRKFIVPGFKRRWGKRDYIERLGEVVEGNYRTTGRFAGQLARDLIELKFQIGTHWNEMSDHEKANIRRTITEVAFLVSAIVLANIAIVKIKEIDDEGEERLWAFMAYQALRLKSELLFFMNPADTFAILRSPMASMSVIENLGRLLSQMVTEPTARYERGPWKGQLKINKTLVNTVPGYRQYYRVRDQRDQLAWFSTKIN